ncbi:hypothetical protein IAT40_005101 [Kwoniella sp. CBS 6097]
MTTSSPPSLPATHNEINRRNLFELLIPNILSTDATLLNQLLSVPNKVLRDTLLSYSFNELLVEVPTDISSSSLAIAKKVDAILRFPSIAKHVVTLRFSHPAAYTHQSVRSVPYDLEREHEAEDERLALWAFAAKLVSSCTRLVGLDWMLGFGVGRPLWDSIGSASHLRHLKIGHPGVHPRRDPLEAPNFPRISPKQPPASPWTMMDHAVSTKSPDGSSVVDGRWGLGPGWEHLETLQLGPLNETGVKTVSAYLQGPHSINIHTVGLESHLLDALLCQSIGKLGSKGVLTHVELSSSGTRLTADLLKGVIEGCISLESLKLNDVEGHLSKNTWSLIEDWPSRFSSLEIVIKDYTKHKSWALDHLTSIHDVPFHQLRHFAVRRSVHPVNLLLYPPSGAINVPTTGGMELKPLSETLIETILEKGSQLESLCLDWWEVTGQALLAVLSAHSGLDTVQVAVSAAIASIVSNMPKSLGISELKRLIVSTDPTVYPAAQTTAKNRISYVDPTDSDLPQALLDKIVEPDPNLPDIKDLRKLAGRLPHLSQLVWTGPGGRGSWTFTRKPKSSLIGVSFVHSAVITRDIWDECQQAAPNYDYSEIIETKSTLTELESPAEKCPPSTSVPSTPVLEEQLLSRSTTTESTLVRTPKSAVTPSTPNPDRAAGVELHSCGKSSDTTPPKSMKERPLPRARRVSEPATPDRVIRKSVSASAKIRQGTIALPTSTSKSKAKIVRSPPTSQPTTPATHTGQTQTTSSMTSHLAALSPRSRGGAGGVAVIRARSVSHSLSVIPLTASFASASSASPSVPAGSVDRIVPGSGGRAAPAVQVLGRVNAPRAPSIGSPRKSGASSEDSVSSTERPSKQAVRRGEMDGDGWIVVGGSTRDIKKRNSTAKKGTKVDRKTSRTGSKVSARKA